MIQLISEFLGTGSWDEARKFADDHPGLRDALVVMRLVNTAQQTADTDEPRANELYQHATVLCGSDDPEVAALIAQLVGTARGLAAGPPKDRELASTFLSLVGTEDTIAKIGAAHYRIKAQVLDLVAIAVANLARYTHDARPYLHTAVSHAQAAVDSTPEDSNDRPMYLNNLANWYAALYSATGNREHLHTAIGHAQAAVDATPEDSNDRPMYLNNLAAHYAALYSATGNREHLHTAIGHAQAAVDATPEDSNDRPMYLSNLANWYDTLYSATSHREHLHTAIGHAQAAIDSTPEGSNDRPVRLSNLAAHYAALYSATGNREHLHTAIGHAQAAVDATPEDSNDRPGYLNNLAAHYAALYSATGNREHLHTAIGHAQAAVDATPEDSNDRPGYLNNLANRYADLYSATGNREHLHTAVGHAQAAVDATPEDSTDRPVHLNNLALRYAALYSATGNPEHLRTSVGHAQAAVDSTPDDSNDRPASLNNLANRYAALYSATGNREHLHTAIGHAQAAVDATPDDSNDRPGYLNNLANRYADLYSATGNREHLHTAVGHAQAAVDATPDDSNDRPGYLNNLANHYADLFAATREEELLREGLSVLVSSPAPLDALKIERTRARLLMGLDRSDEAARVLEAALGLLDDERIRLGNDGEGLRDLAGEVEGMTGDLAFLHSRLQDADQMVKVLEQPRIWLSTPPKLRASPSDGSPAVWVIPSQWGAAVVSRIGGEFTVAETGITREDLSGLVVDMLNAHRSHSGSDATRDLIETANTMTTLFPPVEQLLVIPVGVASLIPWYACAGSSGRLLVETTTITVAPSLAWANTKAVSVGSGPPVGFFHPGIPQTSNWLNLEPDRRAFVQLTGGLPHDSPTVAGTIGALESDASIGHFSCHAGYNGLDPLGSAIELAEPVTLRDLHNLKRCPPLINLSACETGIPDLSRSEQALSFPTSFLRAGANQVIGTLWPIRNDIAIAFNTAFYTHLNSGSDPATACRQAIRNLIAQALPVAGTKRLTSTDLTGEPVPDETWADAGNWAAFTHYGNPHTPG